MAKVPTYRPGEKMCDQFFLTAKARKFRDKQFKEQAIEYLPGEWSNDPETLMIKDKLSESLTKAFESNVDEDGRVYGNGVRDNFYGLRHINGFPMRPATFPWTDNRHVREQQGLANDWVEPWHKYVLEAIVELFFSDLEAEPLKLKEGSSSMVPFFTNKMIEKMEISRSALKNAEAAGKLMLEGKYEEAYNTYLIGGPSSTVYRRQSSDGITKNEKGEWISKDRPVADMTFALTGGREGSYQPSNKIFGKEVDFHAPKGFFRERNRTAKGVQLGVNAILMVIAQPVRTSIYAKYPGVLHHTTREALRSDVSQYVYSIAGDVSNHDQLWFTRALDTIADKLLDMGFADWWVAIYRFKGRMATYVTDVDEGLGNIMMGNPFTPEYHEGLPSGNAFTDLEGSMLMIALYFIVMVEHTYPVIIRELKEPRSAVRIVEMFLQDRLPIRLKDKSDDAILGWTDKTLIPAAHKLHEKMKKGEQINPYMHISYEHGGAFLGSILLYPESKNPAEVRAIGNIQSFVVNQFSPEYGVFSGVKDRSKLKRPYPGLAWASYKDVYGSSPIYGEVCDQIERAWFDVKGESYSVYRDNLYKQDVQRLHLATAKQRQFSFSDLTPIELEVMADPSKLEYKYHHSDVRPEVLDQLFKGLDILEVAPIFKGIYQNV